jgi:FixJ family two-component response regulator
MARFMNKRTDEEEPTVVVIDDDDSVRQALRGLFESVRLRTETYGSVQAFLAAAAPSAPCCIVLDIRLPGQSGLEFQEALARVNDPRPIVLISAHVDVAMAVRAMKAGAVDVLTKPVREQDLLEAVNRAIARDRQQRGETRQRAELQSKFATLTDRERQVMALVAAGKLNKQIAAEVDLTEATVKLHRGQVMRKMGADSIAQLVRMADTLGLQDAASGSTQGK